MLQQTTSFLLIPDSSLSRCMEQNLKEEIHGRDSHTNAVPQLLPDIAQDPMRNVEYGVDVNLDCDHCLNYFSLCSLYSCFGSTLSSCPYGLSTTPQRACSSQLGGSSPVRPYDMKRLLVLISTLVMMNIVYYARTFSNSILEMKAYPLKGLSCLSLQFIFIVVVSL